MDNNSVISIQVHSCTLIASLAANTLRITLEMNHHDELLYVAPKYSKDYFPQQLQILFQDVNGFYEYLYKMAVKSQVDRISFKNGLLTVKVSIDQKFREIKIRMRCMREEKTYQQGENNNFLLTSIVSEPSEHRASRASSIGRSGVNLKMMSSKVQTESKTLQGMPGARLKLMMLKENSKMKKAINRIPEYSSSTTTQPIREYPYMKPQTINRYDKVKTDESTPNRKSFSESKAFQEMRDMRRGPSFESRKGVISRIKMNKDNLDLSNKQIRWQEVKEFITQDWPGLSVLNLGYNNIGNDGLKILTSVRWPALKILYVCFNNISKIQWTPENICFVKTLSLSGNKIKQLPKNIVELEFLHELFLYNNKIQILPEELIFLEELKNISIYGNKLDLNKNKKVIAKLRGRKVQVWE